MQHTICIFCTDCGNFDGIIQGKASNKTSSTVFPQYPIGSWKSFRRRVGNFEFLSLYINFEMFPDSTGSKNEHFKTFFSFVNVYCSSLHRSDKHGPLPASVLIAFCGT